MLRKVNIIAKSGLWQGTKWAGIREIANISYARPAHFPVERFADIKVKQDGKLINLYSYKYPAKSGPPKAVAVLL